MSLSNEPMKNTLAAYIPQQSEPQRSDDFSFRFGEGESLKGVWRVLRKRKMTIWAGGLCGLAIAFLICLLMGRQYAATATIEVQKTDASQTSLLNSSAPLPGSTEELKTDIATNVKVLQSANVLLAVVRDLNLQSEAPFAFKPTILGALTGTNEHIRDEIQRGLPLEQAPYSRDRILKIFEKKLKIENTPDTRLITLQYLSPNPKRAADIANAIVREYVTFEARSQATSDAQRWLSEQLADLKSNVENSQDGLADFEQKSGLNGILLGAVGESGGVGNSTHIPVIDSLDVLNQQLTAAETDRIAKEAVYSLTKSKNPQVVASLGASSDSSNPASEIAVSDAALELLRNLRRQQSTLRVTYADMLTKYGANNQHLLEAKSQLDSLNSQITEELTRINETARQEYFLAARKEAGLRQAFLLEQQKAGTLNVSSVKLQALSQEAASSRQLYDALDGRLKQVNIQAALRATNISVADPARSPAKPTRPNPPLYLAIGLIAGLFTGISSAFVREHLDDTVTVALQLHAGGRLPMLGNIPSLREFGSLRPKPGILSTVAESSPLINDPKSVAAESFRALRTAIIVASRSGHLRSLVVTSPLFGEGRSTVAYNTALAFALAGKRVLLLDADMRKPRLHDLFGCSRSPGLSDVLTGTVKLAGNIRQHRTVPSLFLLPAGSDTSAPAELLGSSQFDELLANLTHEYDLVVADSPPILLVSEARVLSDKFGATLAVIRAGKTTRTVLASLSSVLEFNGSRAVGLVLNGVDTNSIDYFDAYGHNGRGEYLNA
jgi:capsular exopolysaccharide synthesis family protein